MSGHPIGVRGGDLRRDLSSYHPPEQPHNWYTKRPTGTQPDLVLTRDAQIQMLQDRLGIDESSILERDAPERRREARWLSSSRRDLLRELDLANWEPDRLGWSRMWRTEEAESEWIQRFYSHLFLRVNEFVTDSFGHGDIETGTRCVWTSQDFSKHFVHYAQLVALQDNHSGGWDWMLQTGRQRVYLVVGIIGKMLQTHVFDDLLFGGGESAKSILESQDEGLITLEGYQRTDLRGRTVKAILGHSHVPERFWETVDVLTTKIATTLLPLIDLMDEHFPWRRGVSLRGIYQDLHYIVAEAGFFSLTLRESKDIFRFTWPFPGQAWDLDQANHDDELYRESLNQNKRLQEEQRRQCQDGQRREQDEGEPHPDEDIEEEEEDDAFVTPPSSFGSPTASVKKFQFMNKMKKRIKKIKPLPMLPDAGSQIAKVHICLWPMLQRFSNPTPRWEQPLAPDPEYEIERGTQYVTTIARARVVYYLGSTDERAEPVERIPSLADHIASHRRPLSLSRLPRIPGVSRAGIHRLALMGLGLMALLAVTAVFFPFALPLLIAIDGFFLDVMDKTVWVAGLVDLNALYFFWTAVSKIFYGVDAVVDMVEPTAWRTWHVINAIFRAAREAVTDNPAT